MSLGFAGGQRLCLRRVRGRVRTYADDADTTCRFTARHPRADADGDSRFPSRLDFDRARRVDVNRTSKRLRDHRDGRSVSVHDIESRRL